MAKVFAVLREEAERVSELKNISASNNLPYGTLVLGSEGIKDAIQNFDDARKSDIENERLPPDLIDPEDAKAFLSGQPTDGEASPQTMESPGLFASSGSSSPSGTPSSPTSPTTSGAPFRRGHGRQSSLGTTSTSPSTRRRSIENTKSLLRDVVEGKVSEGKDNELEALADTLTSPVRKRSGSISNLADVAEEPKK